MSDGAARAGRDAGGFFDRIRVPVAFGLAVLLVAGVYYYLFYQKKASYLTSRNFRFLATMGAQVEASLANRSRLLRNLEKSSEAMDLIRDPKLTSERKARKREVLADFARGFQDVEVSEGAPTLGEPLLGIKDLRNETRIEVFQKVTAGKEAVLYGWIKPQRLLEPLLHSRKVFDAVLLADASGKVVYQQGEKELKITDLSSVLSQGWSPGVKTGNEKAEEKPPDLSGSGRFFKVELSGQEYRLFVQPVLLPLQRLNDSTPFGSPVVKDNSRVWLICGLTANQEFVQQSLAVSSALLTLLLGLLLLAALGWPFLKLRLLGETQRIGVFDVLLLGICCVLGLSVATVFFLDIWSFHALKGTAKQQAQELAVQIDRNARNEIVDSFQHLSQLEHDAIKAIKDAPETTEYPNTLAAKSLAPGASYPFSQVFTLVKNNGEQAYKWGINKRVPAMLPVQERTYFQRVTNRNLWDARQIPTVSVRFRDREPALFIEPLVTWNNGRRMAVIAKSTAPQLKRLSSRDLTVATLTIPMVSLIQPVLPPGFKFAVLDNEDDNGKVLFHSDPERNGMEDFFIETDRDRRLRSAVFARRSETLQIRYWGEDYIAHVIPMRGLPWTVVALRDLKLLRVVHMEWISTTLFFLLAYVGPLALAFLGIAIARPAYRAEWMWPDPKLHESYRKLTAGYLLAVPGVLLTVRALHSSPAVLFIVSLLLPLSALCMAYLCLRRQDSKRRPAALVFGSALLVAITLFLLLSPLESGADRLWGLPALALLATAFLTAADIPARVRPSRPEASAAEPELRSVAFAYCLAATLLLVLVSVLPTLGFFQAARRIHTDNFKKHGQLKLAIELKQRALRAKQEFTADSGTDKDRLLPLRLQMRRDIYSAAFYGTEAEIPQKPSGSTRDCQEDPRTLLTASLEHLLPGSSDRGGEMRELLHSGASDCTWHWASEKSGALVLRSNDYPDGELVLTSPDGTPRTPNAVRTAGLSLSSQDGGWAAFVPVLLSLALLPLLAVAVTIFVARRIFLIDLLEPLWSEEPTNGRNFFVVTGSNRWKNTINLDNYFLFDIKDLRDPEKGWPARRCDLMDSDKVILVEGFDHQRGDEKLSRQKLVFLEDLARLEDRTVIVFSLKSPSLFLGGDDDAQKLAELEKRWRTLLSSFIVREESLRQVTKLVRDAADPQEQPFTAGEEADPKTKRVTDPVLLSECGPNPRLIAIARELNSSVGGFSGEQILEEFGERAEGHYRALWESCSIEEQIVLEHLAEEGLVNEKSRRLIRRLMSRGLVRRDPNFRLMNETFRRFVVSSICKNEVRTREREAGPSPWDSLRGPLFASLAASVVFFVTTQHALLEGVLASIAGLTAGLPAVFKIFETLGGRPTIPKFGGKP